MGKLLVIEGIDGAGKRTLTEALVRSWRADGVRVATAAFPRYGESVHADLGSEALHGQHGDLADSVYGMALMWALDRREHRAGLAAQVAAHDIVLLDRYVASNAAYGCARLRQGPADGFADWVREMEFERFGLPVPDRHLLLAVPVEVARERARGREAQDASRTRDAYERDEGLQARTAAVYEQLAAANWLAPWTITRVGELAGPDAIGALAARLVG
ncbi:dTMP kinase [Tomitella biformata]|uniref:dTMP kinase n=1 Tax=Tomitella biformata TaxID=630403 RepID=UPI000466BFE9|nr:dTMP kinase [Tomitella biformata]